MHKINFFGQLTRLILHYVSNRFSALIYKKAEHCIRETRNILHCFINIHRACIFVECNDSRSNSNTRANYRVAHVVNAFMDCATLIYIPIDAKSAARSLTKFVKETTKKPEFPDSRLKYEIFHF